MEVLCACDHRYFPHTATMLCSLLEHNTVSRIHLFYSSINRPDLAVLTSFVTKGGSTLVPYKIAPAEFQDARVDKHAAIANYYRILAPRILPENINKILYLDSDVIIRRSLDEVWNTDMGEHALAAVAEDEGGGQGNIGNSLAGNIGLPAGAKYFNSGVLLINLSYWRKYRIYERVRDFIRNNPERLEWWDQDALNAILFNCWIELPACWNAKAELSMSPLAFEPHIVHFCGTVKPWHWSEEYLLKSEYLIYKTEYHVYRRKTPWARYRPEGQPRLHQRVRRYLRKFARAAAPPGPGQ